MSALIIPIPAPATPSAPQPKRQPLKGGVLDATTALTQMNDHFFVGDRDGEIGIYRVEDDGAITFLQNDQFGLLVGNIFVQVGGRAPGSQDKLIPVARFWLSHPERRTYRRIV